MRWLLLAFVLLCLPFGSVFAQQASPVPVLAITPPVGSFTATHQVRGTGFGAGAQLTLVMFDPSGNESVMTQPADGSGNFDLTLTAPAGFGWREGVYRVAIALPGGLSVSATFVASDGKPHLYTLPFSPSPTSAYVFMGTGLPANAPRDVFVVFPADLGQFTYHVTTDANGMFWLYIWPQQFGLAFFSAGPYRAFVLNTDASGIVTTREHPVSAEIAVASPVLPGTPARMTFRNYIRGRYLWGVYADQDGHPLGEFLVGPADEGGRVAAAIQLPGLAPGRYLVATPYDWGETDFTVPQPTPTATSTPTSTPTVTPTPTPTFRPTPKPKPTATARPKPTPTRVCKKTPKKRCKA